MDITYFKIILYIFFGILPSLTWLFYYLLKDLHPEPKKTILRIFLWGALSTIPVFFIQMGFIILLSKADISPILTSIIYWFLIISLSEELLKYLVVKFKMLESPDLDEPLDLMLYMVVSALGFAALENILYLFSPTDGMTLQQVLSATMSVSLIRFLGATFLHTLCSAIIGYFIALSIYYHNKRVLLMSTGFILAVLLHGFFNFSIIKIENYQSLIVPGIALVVAGFLTFLGFEQLKRLKSITKIDQ